jgi:hypothetical protein
MSFAERTNAAFFVNNPSLSDLHSQRPSTFPSTDLSKEFRQIDLVLCLFPNMSSVGAKISFAGVARQVIEKQVRPSQAASRPSFLAMQPQNMQALVRSLMPSSTQKNWTRIFMELFLSFLLLAVSAVHIYHGALLFHRVVVNTKVQPGRACASSSFLINSSAIGIVDPRFCPNLRLAQPTVSCSNIGSNVADVQASAILNIPNKMFFFAQDCAATNISNSPQCKAFLASSLSPDSSAILESQSQFSVPFFRQLSKFCSASIAHLATSANDATTEITSIMSLTPSISHPSTFSPFCSCDAAWAVILLDSRGEGANTAAKFLLQEPMNDASAVQILDGADAAAVNCDNIVLGSACALPTAVRTKSGSGCACLQWIHFESQFWWLLLLLQMTAAVAAWLRDGSALLLPLLAYRDVPAVRSMSFSLPCAIAKAIWRPHILGDSTAVSNMARMDDSDFKQRWLHHFQTYTLAQHLPMFIGSHFFSSVVSMADDQSLRLLFTDLAAQAAIAGLGVR